MKNHAKVGEDSKNSPMGVGKEITNICLKYTMNQFRELREKNGDFNIIWQETTGDDSVSFQISKRQ